MMIGLEYIISLKNISYTNLAEDLGIARQNINQWIKPNKSKHIPKERLIMISKKFNIPEEYIKEELTNELKIKILQHEIENIVKNNGEGLLL